MQGNTSIAVDNTTTVFQHEFLPGFLDSLTKDEKIIVLFAVVFGMVFVSAAIGGIICVLSGSNSKHRRHRAAVRQEREELSENNPGLPYIPRASVNINSTHRSYYIPPTSPTRSRVSTHQVIPPKGLKRLSLSRMSSRSLQSVRSVTSKYHRRSGQKFKRGSRLQASIGQASRASFPTGYNVELDSYPIEYYNIYPLNHGPYNSLDYPQYNSMLVFDASNSNQHQEQGFPEGFPEGFNNSFY